MVQFQREQNKENILFIGDRFIINPRWTYCTNVWYPMHSLLSLSYLGEISVIISLMKRPQVLIFSWHNEEQYIKTIGIHDR